MLSSISGFGNWARTGMVEWKGIFWLFGFYGIVGQPREIHPKFQNQIKFRKMCVPFATHPEFPEYLTESKAPEVSKIFIILLLCVFYYGEKSSNF